MTIEEALNILKQRYPYIQFDWIDVQWRISLFDENNHWKGEALGDNILNILEELIDKYENKYKDTIKHKYIKDALVWSRNLPITKEEGDKTIKGGWIRVHDLCLIQEGEYKGKYCMNIGSNPIFLFSDVYIYEDWMEEFIGTQKPIIKK